MTNLTTYSTTKISHNIVIAALLSAFFTAYLCYIDEGYYNFNWMKDAGNWLMFVIYTSIFTAFQGLMRFLIAIFYNGRYLTVIVSLAFIATVFGLIFFVFKG